MRAIARSRRQLQLLLKNSTAEIFPSHSLFKSLNAFLSWLIDECLQAIDVWTGVCLTFVFGALLEFALVNYASRSDAHRDKMKKQRKQWEMEHQAALDAMGADGLLDDRNSFAMVCNFAHVFFKSHWRIYPPLPHLTHATAMIICRLKHPNEGNKILPCSLTPELAFACHRPPPTWNTYQRMEVKGGRG